MMLQSNGYRVAELLSWCIKLHHSRMKRFGAISPIKVLLRSYIGPIKKGRLWCYRVTVMGFQRNGHGVTA
jgi:hypothetical protein